MTLEKVEIYFKFGHAVQFVMEDDAADMLVELMMGKKCKDYHGDETTLMFERGIAYIAGPPFWHFRVSEVAAVERSPIDDV